LRFGRRRIGPRPIEGREHRVLRLEEYASRVACRNEVPYRSELEAALARVDALASQASCFGYAGLAAFFSTSLYAVLVRRIAS
jgi:hypothetical protein